MKVVSLFSGCGGLDLGFKKAGFEIAWANDNANSVWKTYAKNHPETYFDQRSILHIPSDQIPDRPVGVIGGPPCQSWSDAGKGGGLADKRGALFYEYVRILEDKQPLFFLAENVEGMLSERHQKAFSKITELLESAGYELSVGLINAADFNVPQNRKRVIFVGYRKDLGMKFEFPKTIKPGPVVKDAIWDLRNLAIPCIDPNGNKTNGSLCKVPNHEYWVGTYSYIFMSRNRVLDWELPSYTIQATGRQVSIHPQAPKMERVKKDVMRFVPGSEKKYRRLSIRECARIQTFPDNFLFHYDTLNAGYKMIGNAVPVELGYSFAKKIYSDFESLAKIDSEIESIEQRQDAVLSSENNAPH